MTANNEYKILNDILGVLSKHNTWIDISELKIELFISGVSRKDQLELVLSKLLKDGYIDNDMRKSRFTHATENHYSINFDGNVFLKRGGYLTEIKPVEITEVPENLKELLSIWHDKNDIENLISIFDKNKKHFIGKEPQKTLMSCFAHTLYKNHWLTITNERTHNSAVIAKKFYSLFGWKYFPKDKEQFDYHIELEDFDIQYSSLLNIPLREVK